jgi:type IV pilus assembly protein PilE
VGETTFIQQPDQRMKPNRCNHSQTRAAGFTLIELMIAVAVAALLASIALPSYQNYVRRGQLSDAFTTLADMRVKMEQYYQDNKFYGATSASNACPALSGYGAFDVSTKYFTLQCTAGAAPSQTYELKAVGSSGLTTGYDYSVNQSGVKGTTKFAGSASTAACWQTKAGSCDN